MPAQRTKAPARERVAPTKSHSLKSSHTHKSAHNTKNMRGDSQRKPGAGVHVSTTMMTAAAATTTTTTGSAPGESLSSSLSGGDVVGGAADSEDPANLSSSFSSSSSRSALPRSGQRCEGGVAAHTGRSTRTASSSTTVGSSVYDTESSLEEEEEEETESSGSWGDSDGGWTTELYGTQFSSSSSSSVSLTSCEEETSSSDTSDSTSPSVKAIGKQWRRRRHHHHHRNGQAQDTASNRKKVATRRDLITTSTATVRHGPRLFCSLPYELFIVVCSFLSVDDYRTLLGVSCDHFYAISCADVLVWRDACLAQWQHKQGFRRFVEDFYHLEAFAKREELAVMGLQQRMIRHEFVCEEVRSERVPTVMRDRDVTQRVTCPAVVASERIEQDSAMGADATEEDAASLAHADGSEEGLSSMQPFSRKGLRAAHSHHHRSDLGATCEKTFVDDGEEEEEESVASTGTAPLLRRVRLQERPNSSHRANNGSLSADSHYEHDLDVDGDDPSRHDAEGNHTEEAGTDDDDGMNSTTSGGPRPRRGSAGAHGRIAHRYQHKAASPLPRFLRHVDSLVVEEGHGLDEVGEAGHDETCPELRVVRRTDAVCPCGAFACHEHFKDPSLPNTHNWSHHRSARGEESGNHHPRHGQRHDDDDDDDDGYHEDDEATDKGTRGNRDDGYKGAGEEVEEEDHSDSGGSRTRRYGAKSQHGSRQNHSHAASQKRSNQAGRRRTQKTSAVSSPHPRRRHSRRATHNNNNNTQSDAEQRQRHRRSNSNSNSTHADDDDDVEALLRMLLDPSHHALHDVHHHHVSHRKRGRRQQRRRSHRPKPRKHTNKRKHPHQHSKKDAKMNRAGHHRRRRQQQQQWARLAGEEEADDATQDTHHSGSRITQSRNHNASTAHTSKKNKKKKRRQNSHVQNPKMSKSARRRRRHHQSRLSRYGGAIHAGEEGVEGEDDCGAAGRMASSQSYPRRRRRGVQDDSEGSRTDTNTSTNTSSSSSSNTGVTGGSRTVLYDRHGDGSHSSTNSDDVIALSPTATYQAIKSAIPMHGAQQLAPLPMSSRAALAASSSAAAPGSVGGAALVEQLPATASPHAAGPTVRTPQTLRLPSSPPMTAATAAHTPHLISQGPLPPHHVPGCPLEAQTRAVLSASSATRPPPPPPPPPPAGAADAAGLYWWQMNPDERQRQLRRQQRHEQEEQHRSRRQHEQSRRRGRPGRGRGVHPAVACPCGATLLSTAGAARGDQTRLTHSAHSTTTSTMGYGEESDDAGSESGVGHDSGQGRRRVSSSSSSSTGHGERGSTLTYSPQSSPQQKPPRSRTRTHAEEEELAQWDAFDEEVFQHRQRVLAATAAGVEERKVVLPPPPPMTTTAAVLNQHRYAETEFNVRSGQPVARRGGGDVKEESPFVSAASSSASHSDESCEEQATHRDDCDVEGRSSHLSRHNDCGDLRSNDEDDDTTITGAASPTKRVRFNLAKAHSATTSVAPLTSVTIVELQRALAHDGLSPLENKLAMRRHTTAADGAGGELKTMLPGLHDDDDARAQVLGPAAHEDTTTNTLSVRAVAISSSTLASGSAGRSRGAGGERRRRRRQHRPQQQQQQQQQRRRRRSDMAGTSQRAQPPSPPVEALSGSGSIHVATPTQRGRAAGGGARASAHCRTNNNNNNGCGGGGDSHKRLMRRPLPMPNPYKELEEAMRITRAKSQLIQALHKNTRVAANVATDRLLPQQQHLLHPTRGAHEREERLTVGHGVHRGIAEAPLARDQSMSATNSSTPGTGSPSEPHTHASADGAQHLRGSLPTSVQARVPALLTPLRLPRDGSSLSLPSLSSPATAPAVYTASAIAFAAAADLEMGSGAGSGGGGVNPFVVTTMATPTAATTTTTGMELCQRTVSSGQPRTAVEDVDDDTLEPVSWKFAYYMSRREAHRSLVTMQDLVEGTWYACFRATGHVHPVVFSWAKTIQVQPAISLGALAAPGESARTSGTASTAGVTGMANSSVPLSGASTLQARTSATTPDTTAAPTTTAQQQQQQQQQQQRAMPPLTYHLLQGGAQLVVQSFPVLQIKRRTGTNSANGITTATTATPSLPASAAASSSSSAAAAAAFTLEPQRTLRRLHAMETHGQRGETLSTAGVEASTDTTRDVQASGVSGAAVPKDDTGSTGSVGVAESTYDPDDDWGWTMRNQFVVIFSVDVQAPFYVRKLHRLGGAQ